MNKFKLQVLRVLRHGRMTYGELNKVLSRQAWHAVRNLIATKMIDQYEVDLNNHNPSPWVRHEKVMYYYITKLGEEQYKLYSRVK